MTTLVWNLEENATRRHLLAEALLQLPEERRAQVLEAAEAAGVSDGHHHDLGEVNAAIDALDPDEIAATRVQTGSGTVRCAHGELPIPAPATAAIIARGIPTCERKLEGERCTPTSAAVILHFVQRYDA